MSLTMVLIVEKPRDPDLFRLILCLLKLALSSHIHILLLLLDSLDTSRQSAVSLDSRVSQGGALAAMEGEPAEGEKPPNNPPTTCDT